MSTKNLTLRKFSAEDLDDVILLNRECLPENYTPLFFLDIRKNCPDSFLVAQMNGDILGYIMCRLENGFSDFRKFRVVKKGHIVSIAVKKEYRKKGIGGKLLIEAVNTLKKQKVSECFMEVRTINHNAINLYKKIGFESIRKIKAYYQDGADALVMGIKLVN